MTTPANRQQAFDSFLANEWTPAQAAGIVANLEAESGLRPDAVGDGGLAFGIAQWHPDRQANFARAMGGNIRGSSLAEQLEFVHWELTNTESAAGNALRGCATPSAAAEVVCRHYERPADKDGESRKRAERAEQVFLDCYLSRSDTQAPAPIEDHSPQQEEAMPGIADVIADAAPVVGTIAGGPIGTLIGSLASVLIKSFAPLTQQKITEAVAKHTDPDTAKMVGATLNQGIVDLAQQLTQKSDPVEATVAAAKDPQIIQRIEAATIDKLAELAPYFDKLQQYQQQEWDAQRAEQDAAAARAKSEPWDMTRLLAYTAAGLVSFIVVGLFALNIIIAWKGTATPETLTTLTVQMVTAVIGFMAAIVAYRFGTSRSSSAKDELVAQLAARRQPR